MDWLDELDELLGVKRKAASGRPQPRLSPGARKVFDLEVARFSRPTLFGPAEHVLTDTAQPGSGNHLTLPPHIHPPSTARPWYERRAVSVPAGESMFILDYPVDTDSVVYWSEVGTDQHLNSFYEFHLDGLIFEQVSGAAQVGTVLHPYRFPGAVAAHKSVRLRAYNFNPTPFTYEVVVAGWIDSKDSG